MAITHSDFVRLLPNAMGEHEYTVTGSAASNDMVVNANVHNGKLTINLGEQQERKIALMRVAFIIVSFSFESVSDEQIEVFMKNFDLRGKCSH